VPQQEKIAEIMKECFGDTLVYARIEGEKRDVESGLLEHLPSPEQLKGKILLKVCTTTHNRFYN
jgi:phosphatidylinositol phospholipase C delta